MKNLTSVFAFLLLFQFSSSFAQIEAGVETDLFVTNNFIEVIQGSLDFGDVASKEFEIDLNCDGNNDLRFTAFVCNAFDCTQGVSSFTTLNPNLEYLSDGLSDYAANLPFGTAIQANDPNWVNTTGSIFVQTGSGFGGTINEGNWLNNPFGFLAVRIVEPNDTLTAWLQISTTFTNFQMASVEVERIGSNFDNNGVPPIASFFVNFGDEICPGEFLNFGNNSSCAESYFWDFDNGLTSTEASPFVQFNESGNYQVTLIASNDFGSDTLISTIEVDLIETNPAFIFGPAQACPGNIETYSVPEIEGVLQYVWTLSGGGTILSGNETSQIEVDWEEEGDFLVQVLTFNEICNFTGLTELNVSLGTTTNTQLDINLCDGECFTLNGVDYCNSGFFEDCFVTGSGCDSCFQLSIEVFNEDFTELFETVCENECFPIAGQEVCEEGEYVFNLQGFMGCDSIVQLVLEIENQPMIALGSSSNELNCLFPCVDLFPIVSCLPDNSQILLNGVQNGLDTTAVCFSGTYCLSVLDEAGNELGTDCIDLTEGNFDPPETPVITGNPIVPMDSLGNFSIGTPNFLTANWFTDNPAIDLVLSSGMTEVIFEPTMPDTFNICVALENECGSSDTTCVEIFVPLVTSTKEINRKADLAVFPNPFSDFIEIRANIEQIDQLEIYDCQGKRVFLSETIGNRIPLSYLENGVYFVVLQVENQRIHQKIIKR